MAGIRQIRKHRLRAFKIQGKDSLFIDLFCKDKEGKQNFISLYNALHNTNLDLATTTVQEVNIENVLYTALSNDIAMLVDNKLVVLVEHQSTINENMPLRLLEYVSRIYEQLIPSEDRYEKKMIKIPYPEFFVFYNGTEDYPVETELRLSDAFIFPDEKYNVKSSDLTIEIKVKIININSDKQSPILKQCKKLEEYSLLIDYIRESKKQNPKAPLEQAINKALQNGVLSEYLKRKSTEIKNMLIAEYSRGNSARAAVRAGGGNDNRLRHGNRGGMVLQAAQQPRRRQGDRQEGRLPRARRGRNGCRLSDFLGACARRGGHFGQLLLRHDDLGLADNQRAALDSREPREIGNTSA